MKTVAVITSTRAEFGLLMPVIKELKKYQNDSFNIEVVVTGTHLKKEFGNTIDEIVDNDINPDVVVDIPTDSKNSIDISHNQAITLEKFSDLFVNKKYEGIVILGDRYEMLSIAIAASNAHTPIFHLCGGDTTEGAIDEWIRHSITKMSYLHFSTNEVSYKRIIQLGESPDRIFNYGSTSIDNILNNTNITKQQALNSIGLRDCRYAICTYHPITMESINLDIKLNNFLEAIKAFPSIEFIVTKSNADQGGEKINKLLDNANKTIENIHVFSSLGVSRYISLMKYSEFVLGNSSSGIIEAPSLKIPTINIGDRQRGRSQSKSIINCFDDKESIIKAINRAMTKEFKDECLKAKNIYGNGNASKLISKKIYEVIMNDNIDLKKKFYDIGL